MDAYNEVAVSKIEITTFQINKAFYIELESQGCDSFSFVLRCELIFVSTNIGWL